MVSVQQAAALDEIEVVTLNQYLGADLALVLNATSPTEFNTALVAVLHQSAASDFSARAREQSQMITKRPFIAATFVDHIINSSTAAFMKRGN